ncbi:MAG: UDP-N-acetylmuramoyl-L-alanyl-D-glutamate--2,6-diaminopimelate ligase [Cocleimonas sp.]|nr:UDP-N-acetylmuramoyl-L-alanyl-D-glutamate--2,6-diaminopimelate ligase [Cocleimonas sp.]
MIIHSLQYLLEDIVTKIPTDLQIKGITLDSREIKAGMLFVALKGTQTHGLQYALKAQQQGAVAVIWESDLNLEKHKQEKSSLLNSLRIPTIEIKELATQLGRIATRYYQIQDHNGQIKPNYGLKVIGVTGTDGKTTVTHFIAQAMNVLVADKTAVIGTLGIGLTNKLQTTTHTTPDVLTVHKTLRQLADNGIEVVAMEVSSHALDQARVNDVKFDIAILTNLTRDHLDYHGTVENYAKAKEKLFLRPEVNSVILNQNDAFSLQIINKLTHPNDNKTNNSKACFRYWVKSDASDSNAELVAQDTRFTQQGIEAQVSFAGQQGLLKVAVLGWFNLSNLLATLATMLALDVKFSDALTALSQVKTVPGRMETIDSSNMLVVVDYAHTPGALKSVLSALRSHAKKHLICVFGCGGDRDKGKRPLMAEIAEQGADSVIVTDDNPRTEDSKGIMNDIVAGFKHPENIMIEHNRAKAIRQAIHHAQAGDVVLIAGKGHEQVQIFAHKTERFDDRQQASQALQELIT